MSKLAQTKKKGSFRRNVVASFVVIALLSLAATGAISYWFMSFIGDDTTFRSADALETQIERNMELTAEKNALVINQKLANAEAMIEAAAEECKKLFSADSTYEYRETYYDYFFEYPAQGPHPSDLHNESRYGLNVSWTYSSWYHASSDPINYDTIASQNTDRLGRISNLDFIFQAIHQQMPEFRWLYFAFATNGLFFNYPGSILDRSVHPYDPRTQDWYLDIEAGHGDIVFVEPYYDEFEGVLLISIGKVVYVGGTALGVISGDITIEDINEKILNVQVLESGYASLIQRSGLVIAHPDLDPEEYGEELLPLTQVEINPDGSPAITAAQVAQITLVEQGNTGILRYTRNDTERILVYAPVERGDYICVISVPVEEVLRAIPALETRIEDANLQASLFIVSVTITGIIVAGAVAVVVSNQITRPLQYLMDLATRNVSAMIREESLETLELQVDTMYMSKDDEIGELARAFQGMLDTIRDDGT